MLLLLVSAVVFYRVAPGYSSSGSSASTAASSSASPVPTPVSTQSALTSTTTPGAADSTASTSPGATIQLKSTVSSANAFETVQIRGTYNGGADTFVQVQRWEAGKWLAFPLLARTDQSGQFTAYIDTGPPGRYRLRVLDPDTGRTSRSFVLVIKG